MPETPAGSHARNHSRSAYASPASDSYTQNRSTARPCRKQLCRRIAQRPLENAVTDGTSRRRARHIAANLARIRQRRTCPSGKSRYILARRLSALAVLGVNRSITWEWPDARRLARRHRVLRAVGLPLITSSIAAHRMGFHGHHRPAAVLATPRETPVPGHRLRHHSHRRALHVIRPQPAHEAARRHVGGACCDQLVVHPARRVLLRCPGRPSPVTHFWSLAIEEQFYVVWPVVLILAHKFGVKRTHMRNATFVLALASALEMALLFNPDADPSRVYYGTDTRAFSLLIGAWLAFVWPSNQLGANNEIHLDRNARLAPDAGRHHAYRPGGHDGGHRGYVGVHVPRRHPARLRDHHGHHRRHRAPV